MRRRVRYALPASLQQIMAAILPAPNFRTKPTSQVRGRPVCPPDRSEPSYRSGKRDDYGCYRAFHPPAVHPGQPTTTELASQWPDLTVVHVKASQTRCFAFKDIFVLQFDGERRALAGQLVVRADALALYVVGLKAGWQLG